MFQVRVILNRATFLRARFPPGTRKRKAVAFMRSPRISGFSFRGTNEEKVA
jgi:hypothetical protein